MTSTVQQIADPVISKIVKYGLRVQPVVRPISAGVREIVKILRLQEDGSWMSVKEVRFVHPDFNGDKLVLVSARA
jgi:uncharacterized membrane protein